MTAPAAPTLRVHSNGSTVRVTWRPVLDATDYDLYYADEVSDAGIEAQFDENDLGSDGWYHYTFMPTGSIIALYLTAFNAGAEESDPSDTKTIVLT
jgi:hypothetical protein